MKTTGVIMIKSEHKTLMILENDKVKGDRLKLIKEQQHKLYKKVAKSNDWSSKNAKIFRTCFVSENYKPDLMIELILSDKDLKLNDLIYINTDTPKQDQQVMLNIIHWFKSREAVDLLKDVNEDDMKVKLSATKDLLAKVEEWVKLK